MKRFTKIIMAAAFACLLQAGSVLAQPGQGGGADWANMNPEDMQKMIQQRLMQSMREQLGITNNDEWSLIEKRLSKVSEIRMQSVMTAGMGMMGGMRMGGRMGGQGGPGGQGGGMRGFPGMGQQDPNVESLQKVIDSNGSAAQIKAAVDKLRDSRKQKQDELAKAQADLRSVLTSRQEAILILSGMLE
jgi:hypothetical protein